MALKLTLQTLKRHAIAASLFPPMTLRQAVNRLGFVQADPIRSPARAQDLILRHRVRDYSAGDLEKRYSSLDLEEDFLYAYGFMPLSTWQLLHPRLESKMTSAEKRVLDIVSAQKHLHPRELEAQLGNEREVNAWGGYSKATTHILQRLHHRGLLRIAGRENGVRLYQAAERKHEELETSERLRKLVLLIAQILTPLPESSLRKAFQQLAQYSPVFRGRHSEVTKLINSEELASALVDGVRYVWPAGRVVRKEPPELVRFFAPFDPVVWDRRRFEHLWGWPYRFEAYTPPAKRERGYYAMPLLWRTEVIGWVNISMRHGTLHVKDGFSKQKPNDSSFRSAFEAEVERFRRFLIAVSSKDDEFRAPLRLGRKRSAALVLP